MHLLPSPLCVRGCVRASGLCCVPSCMFAAPVLWGGVMEPRPVEGLSVPVALCAYSAVLSVPSVPPQVQGELRRNEQEHKRVEDRRGRRHVLHRLHWARPYLGEAVR